MQPFDVDKMVAVGQRVRALYPCEEGERVREAVDDDVIRRLALGVAGHLGGKVGIAPRIFLKKLVNLLDRVEEHPDFDPKRDHPLVIGAEELDLEERAAAGVFGGLDAIKLDVTDAKRRDEGLG